MHNSDQVGLTVGQRIKLHRERAGKTRAVLGGLVGRSAEWVKAVETGRLLPPRLTMLNQLAKALKVEVWTIIDTEQPTTQALGPGHAYLPAVREALNRWPIASAGQPEPLEHMRARLATAWRARHAAPDHRTVIGNLLPALIRDAQTAIKAYAGREQREAHAILADVMGLSQMFVAHQPAGDLVWRVVDRAILAAQESENPIALAGAIWFAGQAHRDAGDWDTATAITLDALHILRPQVPDASDELLAMWGALHAEVGLTAARAGEAGRAWHYLDIASGVARKLPADFYQKWTSFSRVIMDPHAVTVEVELRKGGHALRAAEKVNPDAIPSRPRRARHLIEVARSHHLRRDEQSVVGTLTQAYETAPETIRYNVHARAIVSDMLDGTAAQRRRVSDLAARVGLLV
ncbi:helix-turn-helix transcriptional regulator [Micromonospora sonneratiae]|uniref:Multiprotein-bridging factor 1 family protein n=1 Tax=Micromonospora sonneratiae TaxID=1184706 RepID=A0ABW3Y998_9ACTN